MWFPDAPLPLHRFHPVPEGLWWTSHIHVWNTPLTICWLLPTLPNLLITARRSAVPGVFSLHLHESGREQVYNLELTHTSGDPTVESSGQPPPGSVPEMCVSMCFTSEGSRSVRSTNSWNLKICEIIKLIKKELMFILLGALPQSSLSCSSTHFPLLRIKRAPLFPGRNEST